MANNSAASSSSLKRKATTPARDIGIYSVQCDKCHKWREIDTQEDYEAIRSRILEVKFECNKKEGMSCAVPGSLEYDSSNIWAVDTAGLPTTPSGFKRILIHRIDYSKIDAYYETPTGEKCRTLKEVEAYLSAHPEYSYALIEEFSFKVPKMMKDTIHVKTPEPTKESV
ncbi:methyl-CpG-binding domain-containing protein 1 [Capsella rubella]|nr:methyl-CpG-binding domain-containing protein 1 [Capsella rubella]